ncbi:hypothetical protein A33O_20590 [Nitratireductor aquibiodomus RA22]|uniref:Uncharacterized protein n=1 Tax=Nitratireductor aquibiodomus RA22 TaxID=1189611 RepID=I5BRL4_9HYPH|nr:hypothetical protein A33O_20590 [Nitratireductor aquibiodomus RA22]
MQRPTVLQHAGKSLDVARAITAGEAGNRHRNSARLFRQVITLDSPRDKVDLLFAGGIDHEIDEASLYLRPFVAHFVRQPVRIFIEGLVQDTDNQQSAFATRRGFGELLQDENVRAVLGCAFQEFAHLVDEQEQPAMRPRRLGRRFSQRGNKIAFSPTAARPS